MIFPIVCSFSNVYLVKNCGKYILIDAGLPWDENRILRFLRKETLRLDLIFITHAHPDHYGCSRSIHEITKAPIAIHHQDECLLRSGKISLGETKGIGTIVNTPSSVFNKISTFKSPDPNLILHDGDTLESLA